MRALRIQHAGFTFVEVCISLTVLALMLGAIGTTVFTSKRTYQDGMTVAAIEARARRAIDRIAHEMVGARSDFFTPALVDNTTYSSLRFTTCEGLVAGAMQWSTPTQINIVADARDPNDGVDNDGDGLTDECRIVLARNAGAADQIQAVLVDQVREYLEGENGAVNLLDDNGNGLVDERGLSFTYDDESETLTIRLTLEARDQQNRLVTRSVETAVHMRN
ncbi:MAG: hypothetical protein ACKVWV_15280 [Planctomycetota bacterium]